MTARSFVWEKVALAASGAWVGTTAAWVICSIMTFLAARLPNGRGVGSTTTGVGAGAFLALATLETGAAVAARGAEVVTVGTAALAAGCALDLAELAGMGLTAGVREGVGLTGAAAFLAAATGLLATVVLATGLEEAFAAGEAVFLVGALAFGLTGPLTAALGTTLVTGLATSFAATLFGAFTAGLAAALDAAGFTAALATGCLATLLAKGLRPAGTAALAADERPFAFAPAVLAGFADLVAGAFTTGLLSVPDGA
ncbi:hypothetical protein [Hydrogenophaga sp.]|uniref:hypothetical protein n=1 Tax=Hydrogenophaga sp. TaxID=1904254 RepID=UPI00351D0717